MGRVVFGGLAACVLMCGSAGATDAPIWNYDGRFGPDNWASVSSEYSACRNGHAQSPIDLSDAFDTVLPPIELHWASEGWRVANAGNMAELLSEDGGHAMINGVDHDLEVVRFHKPSEHTIDGHRFAMEVQFVHRHPDGAEAIVAVMLNGDGQNQVLERIIGRIPMTFEDEPVDLPDLDLTALVSDLGDRLAYAGSLTQPPCTEGVHWTVLIDPVNVSNAALLAYDVLFADHARPQQPRNRRFVLTD